MDEVSRRSVLGGVVGLSTLAAGAALAQSTAQSSDPADVPASGTATATGAGAGDDSVPASSADQARPFDPARPLEGRVALVTGGARGIGRAAALELARQGANIALVDIADPQGVDGMGNYPLSTPDDLAEAERLVRAQGGRVLSIIADVREYDQMTQAAERTRAELGGIDIVIANAGVNLSNDTLDGYRPAHWSAAMETNVRGVLHTVLASLPSLRASSGGRIVVTTSALGRRGIDDNIIYSSSKWALTGMMKAMAQELGPDGIAVNAVAPSPTNTMLFARNREPALVEKLAAQGTILPVSILAPEDIARAIAFLAGPQAAWISGTTMDVNGGRTANSLA
jgi:NAD(P)-dependent dehydrogenase (short-subunit alcohol dehydrogenase family)